MFVKLHIYHQADFRAQSWGRTEVQKNPAFLQDMVFLIQLNELEGRAGSVALLFRKLIPAIKSTLAMLQINRFSG